jgi:hypothetical protein
VTIRIVLGLLLLFCARQVVSAQEVFRFPQNPKTLPVNYLENWRVKNPSRRLSEKEKHDLCRMFVTAYVITVRKYKMDYLLNTGLPLIRLLAANFPDIKSRMGEGGMIIFMGAITSYFNSLPEYRNDVLQVLRHGISRKNCVPPDQW